MKAWKAWVGIAVVFIAGIFIGALGVHLRYQKVLRAFIRHDPVAMREVIVRRLSYRLDLDASQREKVDEIVKETQEKDIEPIMAEVRPRIEAAIEKSEAKVDTILTPEQREKFEKIKEEHKARFLATQSPAESGTKTSSDSGMNGN